MVTSVEILDSISGDVESELNVGKAALKFLDNLTDQDGCIPALYTRRLGGAVLYAVPKDMMLKGFHGFATDDYIEERVLPGEMTYVEGYLDDDGQERSILIDSSMNGSSEVQDF